MKMTDNAAVLALMMMLCASAAYSCSSVLDEIPKDIDIEEPAREVDDMKVVPGRLKVKFSENVEPKLSLLSAVGAKRMERVFPYAGKFEARTRKEGLDRWYNVWYDEDLPVTKAAGELEKIEGIDIVEKVMPVKGIGFGKPVTILPMGINSMWPYAAFSVPAESGSSSEYLVDDPYLPKQWHYHNDGTRTDAIAGADINLFRAIDILLRFRIAKRRPSLRATGVMSLTVISTLSPGITISVPSGRVISPVTSSVRMKNCGR